MTVRQWIEPAMFATALTMLASTCLITVFARAGRPAMPSMDAPAREAPLPFVAESAANAV